MNNLWNRSNRSRELASPSSYQKQEVIDDEKRTLLSSYNSVSNNISGCWDDNDENNTIMTPTRSRMSKNKRKHILQFFSSTLFYGIAAIILIGVISLLGIKHMNSQIDAIKEQLSQEQNTIDQINALKEQLSQEKNTIDQLNEILQQHEIVIKRFNSSISNQDVLDTVTALQKNISDTTQALYETLDSTIQNIHEQLNSTETHLQKTIEDAENEIHDQVIQVKSDVDQYVIQTQDQFSAENSFMIYQLAGTFTLLSCLISMYHMTSHIRKLNQPEIQRKILAILWMSPIYAITSWFSLVFPKAEGYLAIIKDGYEGYVIYTFLSFCIAVIGKGDRSIVVSVLARYGDHLSPPYRLWSCFEICGLCPAPSYEDNTTQLADDVLFQCQSFAMQFVFLRPLTTTAIVVLKKFNDYDYNLLSGYYDGDGHSFYLSPHLIIMVIQNVSIFVAFSGLLKFYHAVDKELAWCKPFAKFICIKGVVFMTFWQGLAISLLAQTTQGDDNNKAEDWAKSAQNFLICLEMLLFSVAHFYCFPTYEWEEGYRVKHSVPNFSDTVALGDFVADLKLLLSSSNKNNLNKKNAKRVSKKLLTLQPSIPEEDTIETEVDDVDDHDHDDESDAGSNMSSVLDDEESGLGYHHNTVVSMNESVSSSVSSLDDHQKKMKVPSEQDNTQNSLQFDNYFDQQSFIAAALEETLGSMINDPEVAQAKDRLLSNRLLSPSLFDYNFYNDDDRYDSRIQRYLDHLDDGDHDHHHQLSNTEDNQIQPKLQYNNTNSTNNTDLECENDHDEKLLLTDGADRNAAEMKDNDERDNIEGNVQYSRNVTSIDEMGLECGEDNDAVLPSMYAVDDVIIETNDDRVEENRIPSDVVAISAESENNASTHYRNPFDDIPSSMTNDVSPMSSSINEDDRTTQRHDDDDSDIDETDAPPPNGKVLNL